MTSTENQEEKHQNEPKPLENILTDRKDLIKQIWNKLLFLESSFCRQIGSGSNIK